jgi:hypothetical protein
MKIAVDQGITKEIIPILVNMGHHVVYIAEKSEPDEWWMRVALERGCQMFVSRDTDVQNYAINNGVEYVCPKKGQRGDVQIQSILARIKNFENKSQR